MRDDSGPDGGLVKKAASPIQLNLGLVTVPIESIFNIFKIFASTKKRAISVPREDAVRALVAAVNFLISDRCDDKSPGAGGWGISDLAFMDDIHGGSQGITDSVMTTTVAIEALVQFISGLTSLKEWSEAKRQWDSEFCKKAKEYATKRWIPHTGMGGTLKQGSDGVWIPAPRYRHTAWLIRLWRELPGGVKNMKDTITALDRKFRVVNWDSEKVATAVAADTALRVLEIDSRFKGIISTDRIRYLRAAFQDDMKDKYLPDICGWTGGNDVQRGRNLYTLFVLAEMAEDWNNIDMELQSMFHTALDATIVNSHKEAKDSCYIPYCGDAGSDVNACCLAFAALSKKPSLGKEEKHFFDGLGTHLCHYFNKHIQGADRLYAWTVAYYVKAMCDLLAPHK